MSGNQFSIRNIREISNDPLTKFTNQLAKKLSKFTNEQAIEKLESKEDIYSAAQDVDVVIKCHTLVSNTQFTPTHDFYPLNEPDFNKNTLWIQGHNMGNKTRDLSGYSNINDIVGDPILIDGTPFDYGIATGDVKSLALRFNRVDNAGVDHEEEFREYMGIQDDERIRLKDSTDMSWFWRVRPLSTNLDQSKRRTVYCKTDETGTTNSDIDDAIRLSIDPVNKRWVVQIKESGVFYSKETNSNKCVEGNVYDIFVTFNAGIIHLYLAKTGDGTMTDETLSNSGYGEEWGPDLSSIDARLFKRGVSADDGAFHGDFYDFKVYRNNTISSTEANRHWTNKWTTNNIAFGEVMIVDYFSSSVDAGVGGYTTTGYTTTGYTAT